MDYTNNIYFLNDGDLVILGENSITFYDKDLNKIEKNVEVITWNSNAADKGSFDTFMLK